jgi:putative acetyltransferase
VVRGYSMLMARNATEDCILGPVALTSCEVGAFDLTRCRIMPTLTFTIARERPDTAEALALIAELEAVLAPLYPRSSRHGLSVEQLLAQGVLFYVLRAGGEAAGCGGIKVFDDYAEVKRMYVRPAFRGQGCGWRLLDHLAGEARAHGVPHLRLETGIHQAAAITLYERYGFERCAPFGAYQPDPNSLFFEKLVA